MAKKQNRQGASSRSGAARNNQEQPPAEVTLQPGQEQMTAASSAAGGGAESTPPPRVSNRRVGGQPAGPRRADSHAQPRRAERRPEIIRQRKEERRRAYERQRRTWLLTRIGIGVVLVLVVGGIAWGAFRQVEQFQLRDDVVIYGDRDDFSDNHPDGPQQYNVIPPVGGDHNIVWQNCGFYEEPIFNWHGVHSLEHGAVWITHRPELPQEQIDLLEEKAEQSYILVSPYPGLKAPVVASVWGRQIELDGADDERLDAFIREYRRNPETAPEQNGICTSGTTQTTTETPQQTPLGAATPAPAPASPAASPPASPAARLPEIDG